MKGDAAFPAAFWALVAKSDGCWPWTGGCDADGYGKLRVDGKWTKAHRVAWVLTNGPIPDGLWVLHRCDNPPCVNPEHLFLGNQLDNMRDMANKGRAAPRDGERNPSARLTLDEVRKIRARYAAGGVTQRELAKEHGVCRATVSHAVVGRQWRDAT